ncbi:hypothetical protein LBMAG56_02900 [Verrucomicrobiota bacterium]|nr:hypothetical protein LBMAG56_02900 [Verrucomicrobiota bacterium]
MEQLSRLVGNWAVIAALAALTACTKEEAQAPKTDGKPASGLQKTMDNAVGQAQKAAADVKAGTEQAAHEASAAASKAAADASKAAGDAAKAVGDKARSAVDAAKEAVHKTTGTANAEAEKLLAQAKAYLVEKKYPEALDALKSLGNLQLSPEQAGLVESLKAQVQKFLANPAASEPAKVPGNVPGVPKP